MKKIKQLLPLVVLIIIIGGICSNAWAQRNIQYRDLVMQNQQQPLSFNFITLPGDQGNKVVFTSIFSLPYSYLPFKKATGQSAGQEFYSTASLSLEVFKSENVRNGRNKRISVDGLEPAGRTFWSDTAYAKSYEESQSKQKFLSGYLQVPLQPGTYNYVLQIKRGEQTESRVSKTQEVRIKPYDKMETGNLILGERLSKHQDLPRMKLNSMGNNVAYAEDFYVLAYLPAYDPGASYSLGVRSLNVADEDTSKEDRTFSQKLKEDDIIAGVRPHITSQNGKTYLDLVPSENGFAYALVKIPNSSFPNSLYRLTITSDKGANPVAQDTFRSLWIDMPTSLLSLEVAIDMLHFIVDEDIIRDLSTGTQAEREKKFRDFWKKRDPTPNTQFNELMTEYYRRIDYAYENFTTEKTIGYESDQGEIYIKFGPPKNIERKFPPSGPTREIWTYPNRKFVFRATTGFGDFKLVSDQSR